VICGGADSFLERLKQFIAFAGHDAQPRGKLDSLSTLVLKLNVFQLNERLRICLRGKKLAHPLSVFLEVDHEFQRRSVAILVSLEPEGRSDPVTVAIFQVRIGNYEIECVLSRPAL